MQVEQVQIPHPPAPPAPMSPEDLARMQDQLRQQLQALSSADPGAAGEAAQAAYEAARAQRRELGHQLEQLESKRGELSRERQRQVTNGNPEAATGIDSRIAEIDKRIADVDKQIAAADVQVARAAAIPGAVQPDEPPQRNGPPDEVFAIPIVFTIFVLFPIALAYARRIWRRSTPTEMKMPAEWGDRMSRLEQNLDTIAVEVERVSEGQRFMTKALVEGNGGARGLGAGAAQPVEVGAREPVPVKNRG